MIPKEIHNPDEAKQAFDSSIQHPIFIYKHSPICAVSYHAQKEWNKFLSKIPEGIDTYWVNVIGSRIASQSLAQLTGIRHESPQVLLLYKGKCIWNESHGQITEANLLA